MEPKKTVPILTRQIHYALTSIETFFILSHLTLIGVTSHYGLIESAHSIGTATESITILWLIFSTILWFSQGIIIFVRAKCLACEKPPYIKWIVGIRVISTMICNKFASSLILVINDTRNFHVEISTIVLLAMDWIGFSVLIPLDIGLI